MDPIRPAMRSQNVELVKELIQKYYSVFCKMGPFFSYLSNAMETGNMRIIQTVLDNSPSEQEIKSCCSKFQILSYISDLNHDEDKKLEILQCLLPYLFTEDPNRPGFYPIEDIDVFHLILDYCTEKSYILTSFFINTLYTEKYNSLYPLIKKLEAAVDESHHICILLHDDINDLNEVDHKYSFLMYKKNLEQLVQTFLKLLLKDTRESKELAVESFQVLLAKHIDKVFARYFSQFINGAPPPIEAELNGPLMAKLLFQFIFNSIINLDREIQVFYIISLWVKKNYDYRKTIILDRRLLDPFIEEPLQKLIPNVYKYLPLQTTSKQNGVRSLVELCRPVIRCKIFQNVNSIKKFMDRIWSLNLPTTLKCFLLYIPDPSYMDDFSNINLKFSSVKIE